MRLTAAQIEELLGVIDKYTLTFMAHHIGADVLSDAEKKFLAKSGVSLSNLSRTTYNVEQAFKFGILSDALHQSAAQAMNFAGLKKLIDVLEATTTLNLETLDLTDNEISPKMKERLRNSSLQVGSKFEPFGIIF